MVTVALPDVLTFWPGVLELEHPDRPTTTIAVAAAATATERFTRFSFVVLAARRR
jgi:hypothetical protein